MGVSDGGVYRCVADNYLGVDARAQRVNVVGAPAVGPMEPRKAVAGSTVWAHCPYKGYPIRKITWIKSGEGKSGTCNTTLHCECTGFIKFAIGSILFSKMG